MKTPSLWRKTALLGAFTLAALSAQAQELSWRWSLKTGELAPVVAMPVYQLDFGKSKVDVFGFAGALIQNGQVIGGGAVTLPVKFAKNASLNIGPYVEFASGRPVSGGIFVTFTFK